MLLAFTGLHVWTVLKLGVNEWRVRGRLVRRQTYMKEYHEPKRNALRARAVWKGLIFSAAILFAVAGISRSDST